MKTKPYSAHSSSGRAIFENKTLTEAFSLMPAGCKLVSGNSDKIDKQTGKLITTVKATYRRGEEEIVLTEDCPR